MRDIPGPTPGQEVTTPSSAGEAAAASADTSSHSTRHFACDLTMHSASLIPLTVSDGCTRRPAARRRAWLRQGIGQETERQLRCLHTVQRFGRPPVPASGRTIEKTSPSGSTPWVSLETRLFLARPIARKPMVLALPGLVGNNLFGMFLIATFFLLMLRESIQYYKGSTSQILSENHRAGFDRNTSVGAAMLLFWAYRLGRRRGVGIEVKKVL